MSRPTRLTRLVMGLAVVATAAFIAPLALAEPRKTSAPMGSELLRLLGAHAIDALAPRGSLGMGALIRLPPRMQAKDMGLRELAPGIGRLWGSPESIVVFATAHPNLEIAVAPPLHLLLDTSAGYVSATTAIAMGLDGSGAIVGIAHTGLDLSHPDFPAAPRPNPARGLLHFSPAPR